MQYPDGASFLDDPREDPDDVGRGRDAERREADVAEVLGHGL